MGQLVCLLLHEVLITTMKELTQLYSNFFGQAPARIQLLGGAGSNRSYYRMWHGEEADAGSVIGVVGENAKENHAFLALARVMCEQGLPVPRVFLASADEMRYLQQDLGSTSLYDLLSADRKSLAKVGADEDTVSPQTRQLLMQVMRDLPHLQFLTAECFDFANDACREPRFSGMTIRWDLNYFKYCFLKLTGCQIDEMRLESDFERLTTALLDSKSEEEKWAFLYRDFQSRNVMVDEGKPYYIDFQGGYMGPIYYDVASFLWQSRAAYSPALREELLTTYVDALQEYQPISTRVFRHRLRIFVFFRLLQTLGAYGFRGMYEHKAMFLTPIKQALNALVALTHKDSEPAFRNCSLKPGQNATLQALFGDAFDGNWGPDDSAGCNVSDDGFADETQPSIDRFELEEDCPYLCDLLAKVAVMDRFQTQPTEGQLVVKITSFSYKKGIPEDYSGNGGGFVFDCRAPLNPGRYSYYKKLTGLDQPVIDFLEGRRDTDGNLIAVADRVEETDMMSFVQNVYRLVEPAVQTYLDRGFTSLSVNFGCTGGQHRSVYSAQHLAEYLHQKFPKAHIVLTHREQQISQEF